MSHVRQQIRDALKTALTGLTLTGDNVFVNRVDPIEKGAVPALTIRTGSDEKIQNLQMGRPALVLRQVDVMVTAYAVGADVDDVLDAISVDVEKTIALDQTLSGLVKSIEYVESDDVFERSEMLKGVVELGFQCQYIIKEDEPDVAV